MEYSLELGLSDAAETFVSYWEQQAYQRAADPVIVEQLAATMRVAIVAYSATMMRSALEGYYPLQ